MDEENCFNVYIYFYLFMSVLYIGKIPVGR